MSLDQFLQTNGPLGNRTRNALINHVYGGFCGKHPTLTADHETTIKPWIEDAIKNNYCRIRNLGGKGIALLAKFFKIEIPKKTHNVSSLRQQLAKAKKKIAELERELDLLRKRP